MHPDSALTMDAVVRHLRLLDGFGLLIVVAVDRASIRHARAIVQKQLLSIRPGKMQVFSDTEMAATTPEQLVDRWFDLLYERTGESDDVAVNWFECAAHLTINTDRWKTFFQRFNEHRDNFVRRRAAWVMVVTPESEQALRQHAPDLYSVRSFRGEYSRWSERNPLASTPLDYRVRQVDRTASHYGAQPGTRLVFPGGILSSSLDLTQWNETTLALQARDHGDYRAALNHIEGAIKKSQSLSDLLEAHWIRAQLLLDAENTGFEALEEFTRLKSLVDEHSAEIISATSRGLRVSSWMDAKSTALFREAILCFELGILERAVSLRDEVVATSNIYKLVSIDSLEDFTKWQRDVLDLEFLDFLFANANGSATLRMQHADAAVAAAEQLFRETADIVQLQRAFEICANVARTLAIYPNEIPARFVLWRALDFLELVWQLGPDVPSGYTRAAFISLAECSLATGAWDKAQAALQLVESYQSTSQQSSEMLEQLWERDLFVCDCLSARVALALGDREHAIQRFHELATRLHKHCAQHSDSQFSEANTVLSIAVPQPNVQLTEAQYLQLGDSLLNLSPRSRPKLTAPLIALAALGFDLAT